LFFQNCILLAKLNFDVLGRHMEDGELSGVGIVHKGGRGDGDQECTEGESQFWVIKVGAPEIVTIQGGLCLGDLYEILWQINFHRSREALYSRPGAVAEDKNCAIM
jgi:hypothetical protein